MNGGYILPRVAQLYNEPDSVEGYETGGGRAPSPPRTGGPLPSAFVQTARAS